MATQRQIDANRRNAARSKGPVTPEGKEKSSRNSTTHGLSARKIFVLVNESDEVFGDLVAGFVRHYQPGTELEHELCLNIAHTHWRIHRLAVIETGMFDRELARQEKIERRDTDIEEHIRLAGAFEGLAKANGALGLLTRYEGRLQRTLQSLINRIEAVQKKRQNEPNLTGPPADKSPSAPPRQVPDTPVLCPQPVPVPAAIAANSAHSPSHPREPGALPLSLATPQIFVFDSSLAASQKGVKLDSQQF
jgi:hypothetical protein